MAVWALVLALGPGLVGTADAQTVVVQWDRSPCTLATDCPPAPTHFYLYRDLVYAGKLAVSATPLPAEVLRWTFETTAATHWFGVSAVNEVIAATPRQSDIVQIQWCVDGSCAAHRPADTVPPTITAFTQSRNGQSPHTHVHVEAIDNVGVVRIDVWLDSTLIASCAQSPCDATIRTSGSGYTLTAIAYDAAGLFSTRQSAP